MVTTRSGLLAVLPPDSRRRLERIARQVSLPPGTRVFKEGGRADRFWIIDNGSVALDLHVPGRRAVDIDTLGPGDLLGWSWLVPPYTWYLGARTLGHVRATQFEATVVRALCEADPVMGRAVACGVAEIIGRRLHRTRTRLLDLYGPHGSGPER
ncbi:cyclic nucleotide-binding domain-containing protein [Streptomyces sp. B6B3]|uniref:cyclic nucleotide-binding domain-containing protein n=1 Tax=Streptomyces sp. B6B3 TaxID=3153570 RepID=UPI00325DB810